MDLHLAGAVDTVLGFLVTLRRLLSTGHTGRLRTLTLALLLVGPGVLLATDREPAPDAGVSTGPSDPAAAVERSPAKVGSPATGAVEGQSCSLHRPEKGVCGLQFPGAESDEHPARLSD